jgi:AcrR family transcriptional regulator
MCQTMLHVGLGLFHQYAPDRVAKVLCTMMLGGLAARFPSSADLDRSSALIAVKNVIDQWQTDAEPEPGDRASMIRAIARTEFGRRGYEVTTVRDIAAVAGLGTGSVYRVIGSKEDLLASIMRGFAEKTVAGWDAALNSDSTIIEKLDAVAWLQINVIDRFYDEFRIQLAWLRQVPPEIPRFGWSFPTLLRRLKAELTEGVKSGELVADSPSAELTARCVVELTWIPYNIISEGGTRTALAHARDTLLRGVAKRGK